MFVSMAMQLALLINVDELEQHMHTNVWLTLVRFYCRFSESKVQKWHDYQLQWNPKDYDNITTLRIAPEKIWLPDIVLFNK